VLRVQAVESIRIGGFGGAKNGRALAGKTGNWGALVAIVLIGMPMHSGANLERM
jgi:hypothetical protein